MRIYLIWLFLIGFLIPLQGQELHFRQFTMQDGLSQMKVNSILKDQKGYLWLGTRNGLNRFDGENFEIFTTEDGLSHNRIHHIEQYNDGRLLIMTFGGISIFDGETFESINIEFPRVIYETVMDNNEDYWILESDTGKLFKLNSKLQITEVEFPHPTENIQYAYKLLFDSTSQNKYLITAKYALEFDSNYVAQLDLPYQNDETSAFLIGNEQNAFHTLNDKFYIIQDSEFIEIDEKSVFENLQLAVFNPHLTARYQKYIQNWADYENIRNEIVGVLDIHEEADGSIWAASENGLIHISFPSIYAFNEIDAPYIWTVVEDDTGNILLGSYGHGLLKYNDNDGIQKYSPPIEGYFFAASSINKSGKIVLGHMGSYFIIQNNEFQEVKERTVFSADYDEEQDQFVMGTTGGIFLLQDDNSRIYIDHNQGLHENTYIQSIGIDSEGNYWLGSYEGLSKFNYKKNQSVRYTKNNGKLPMEGVFAVFEDSYGTIWLGGDNGLMRYQPESDSIHIVTSNIITTNVKSIGPFNEDYILIACKEGLYILNSKQYQESGNLDIKTINLSNGYTGIEPGFEGLFLDSKNRIWCTSSTSLNIIHPDEHKIIDQSLKANIVRLDGNLIPYYHSDSIFELVQGQDFVSLEFDAIGTQRPNKTLYQYSINSGPWSSWSEENTLRLNKLQHGNHFIKVKAGPTDQEVDSQFLDQINIRVNIPFYNQQWFLPAILGVLLTAFVLLISNLILSWKARKQYQSQLIRSKYLRNQLLLAELNPHFIFNVLASIQNKILTGKKQEASDYLIKLSGIMRNFLHASHRSNSIDDGYNNEISLEKELELLGSFVEFEQMKSDNHFEYEIKIDPSIDAHNSYLPPMIIQPFVENAIKHGLLLSDKMPKLLIEFTRENEFLKCVIIDNGVGRKRSAEIYSKMLNKKQSLGTKIVEERIELLNDLGMRIFHETSDNSPTGTIVKLLISEE